MSITLETFVIMQTTLLASSKYTGSDRIADVYYEALDVLKISGVTKIGERLIGEF